MDKTVLEWLLEVRKSNGIVSGLRFQAAAESALHILMDDILAFDEIPFGRPVSFTSSWHSRMTQEYSVAYCGLKGEAGSVVKDAIAERMNEIPKHLAQGIHVLPEVPITSMRHGNGYMTLGLFKQ
ncbi:hypothetical protein BGZ90_005843 [Linnemannia elongata]|nr:hypothetical protein BGZ90_005843 [Linnemannia elongata]